MGDQLRMPSYNNPPVMEVVCGVQFSHLRNFLSAHFGAYWDTIKDEFPSIKDMPPLSSIIDPGPGGVLSDTIEFQFSAMLPLRRVFFIQEPQNGLIQLQPDRYHYNWRKVKDDDVYPRYSFVKEQFLKKWEGFNQFIEKENLGPIQPIQYELTYVNHMLQGELWASIADLADILPPLHWISPSEEFLPSPDRLEWTVAFPCERCNGHLVVALKHGQRKSDKRGLFILELTMRGFPQNPSCSMAEWFDTAREWIVRGFTSVTSKNAHEHWGRFE